MRHTFASIALLLFAAGPAFSSGPPAENIAALVESALANNPELQASKSRWQMFASRARQAGTLEDPMLMLKLQNMVNRYPTSFDRDTNTAKVIGISQQIPSWGKRQLRQEIADYEADSYQWQLAERKIELARMVRETCYQLYSLDKALELIDRNIRIAGDFLAITESRYSVGQGTQADILKAGLDRSKMLEMQVNLQQQRKSLAANLNYLVSRPDGTPVGTMPDIQLPPVTASVDDLVQQASRNRPQLRSLESLVSKSDAAFVLAGREYYPDFGVSLEYMQREPAMGDPGYDMYSLALTFNLPVQRERREAMAAESAAESAMAKAEIAALQNSIRYTVHDALAQMERRRQLIELYRSGIIPQAEQALESALINYRVGKVDFLTLLDSKTALFNFQRELHDSEAEYLMALARLDATVGGLPAAKSESERGL